MNRLHRFARVALNALFWPWNIVLCCLALFGYVPLALVDLVLDAVDGLARWDFVAGSLVMVVVPPATLAYAFAHRKHFKEAPSELAVLFFGVELPLLACTAARLFGFQQLTGAAQFVYVALVAGGVVAESRLIFGKHLPRSQLFDGVAHGLLVLRACAGAYVGLLLATMSMPLLLRGGVELATLANELRSAEQAVGVVFAGVVLSPLILFVGASALLVLTLPITAPLSWIHALRRSGRELRAAWGLDDLLFASAAPILVGAVCVAVLLPQPHVEAFRALKELPQNDEERRALVQQQEAISAGLVDAYLGKHRYIADDVNDTWAQLWSFEGELVSPHQLRPLDEAMNEAARPFTYAGRMPESQRAAQLYRDFFGRELERDHAATVRDALSATWSQEERFAGFINEGQQRVRLHSQQVTAQSHDGVVDVEVHDEWVNQTANDEEVALFFELPESAAVTGLWMSPTANKDDGSKFVIAPRGAAQQLYNEEVRARRDPALLEQVGPRQYRLRVFPIPARPPREKNAIGTSSSSSWAGLDAPRVHVWMSYQTLPDVDGATPTPMLRERRNGFWDEHSTRTMNGTAIGSVDAVYGGGWVQGAPGKGPTPQPVVADVDGVCVRLTPAAAPAPALAGKTVDVVVDRSLELDAHKAALRQALQAITDSGARVRFVLGTSALRGEPAKAADAVDVDDLVFFGAARPKDLLRQLLALRGDGLGDAVIVLSGSASFDVADDSKLELARLPGGKLPPTVLVHVTGAMPKGYDDVTLDALRRSGGNATADITSALARLSSQSWVDGHRVDVDGSCPGAFGARAIAARQRILAADRGGLAPPDALDRLHRTAVIAGVVTPYSSMIVLLEERQRQRLAELNQQQDRFDREVEADTKAGALAGKKAAAKDDADAPRDAALGDDSVEGERIEQPRRRPSPPSAQESSAPAAPSVQARAEVAKMSATTSSELAADPMPMSPTTAVPNAAQPTTTTTAPAVSGVPEPHEWLLLLLGGIAVFVFERRRRRAV